MFSHQIGNGVVGNHTAQNNYQGAVNQPAANAPRELRIMERLSGLNGSVDELASYLESFTGRLKGTGQNTAVEKSPSDGILDTISRIEDGLRRCHELVRTLDDAF